MRLACFLMFILLIMASTAQAQVINWIGIKTGVAIANQDFDYTANFHLDAKNRTGLSIGASIEWLSFSHFSLITETSYVQKGMVLELKISTPQNPQPIGTIKSNSRVDYLSIPILVKLVYEHRAISPYMIIGPRFDLLLSYKKKYGMDIIYDKFKNLDFGGDIGLGIESNVFKSIPMLFEIRFSPSFSNSYETDKLKVKNKALEVLFGMKIKINKK